MHFGTVEATARDFRKKFSPRNPAKPVAKFSGMPL